MRGLTVTAMAIAVAFFVASLLVRLIYYGHFGPSLMDDAFFFVRYANNFLDTGVFAWNAGEGPVYGNTSQLYQLLVTALVWLTDRNAVLSVSLASVLGALAYLVILPAAYRASRPQTESGVRLIVTAILVALIAFDGQLFLLLGTGMETTWALALLSLSLLVSFRVQNGASDWPMALLNGICVAAVFATRPDATAMALAAPAGLALFAEQERLRRTGLIICLMSLALIAAVMGLCWLYYGDPLPLAFQAKTIPLTGLPTEGHALALDWPVQNLANTLLWHAPETVLGLVALLFFFRLSPVMRGAVVGMAVFLAYHLIFVLPIMGYFGRFLAPIIVVLTLLATGPLEAIVRHSGLAGGLRKVGFAGAILLCGLALLLAHKMVPTAVRVAAYHWPGENLDLSLSTSERAIARAADEFPFFRPHMGKLVRALGDDCSIASTEDGILSAFARRNRIVDYSGLHDRRFIREGFSAERLLTELRPDVLALPPAWYKEWDQALQNHPAFQRDYLVERPLNETGYPMAFRKDSACAARVRRALYGK